jgi:hypothetical protein
VTPTRWYGSGLVILNPKVSGAGEMDRIGHWIMPLSGGELAHGRAMKQMSRGVCWL